MNSVVLSYYAGTFTATVTVALNWTIMGVWLSGGGMVNLQMAGTIPAAGAGTFVYKWSVPPMPPGPGPTPGTYTATVAFQTQQQQTAQGQCQV